MTIPDAPGLPSGIVAWARYGDYAALVADEEQFIQHEGCLLDQPPRRYTVSAGRLEVPALGGMPLCSCEQGLPGLLPVIGLFDDYAEALAVWQKHADALAGREEDA